MANAVRLTGHPAFGLKAHGRVLSKSAKRRIECSTCAAVRLETPLSSIVASACPANVRDRADQVPSVLGTLREQAQAATRPMQGREAPYAEEATV
jgi:hypothetical protein